MSVKITCEEEKLCFCESGSYVAKRESKEEKKSRNKERRREEKGEERPRYGVTPPNHGAVPKLQAGVLHGSHSFSLERSM